METPGAAFHVLRRALRVGSPTHLEYDLLEVDEPADGEADLEVRGLLGRLHDLLAVPHRYHPQLAQRARHGLEGGQERRGHLEAGAGE
jgi:hypothetical protein